MNTKKMALAKKEISKKMRKVRYSERQLREMDEMAQALVDNLNKNV